MAPAFTGTAVQRLTEQAMELFGGMGVIQGMPIEKYVRDALIQKHISFPFPTRFKIAEALAGYQAQGSAFCGSELMRFAVTTLSLVTNFVVTRAAAASCAVRPLLLIAIVMGTLLLFPLAGVAAPAAADSYPTRPIRFIVPFPPGGGTDIYARIIGPKLAEALRQQVVVDNRPGAAGALGAELAAKSPPDGYTIWIGQVSNLVIVPALRPKLGYDPVRDFAPITLISKAPSAMVVNADSPLTSIKALVAAAKGSPGKLTYATAGVGSSSHIAGEMFKQAAGIDVTHVPYKGASPAMIDLRGGRVSYMGTSLASANQFVREGKIRAIATTGMKRARLLPDVPTIAEQGYPGFESVSWLGMLAPARVRAHHRSAQQGNRGVAAEPRGAEDGARRRRRNRARHAGGVRRVPEERAAEMGAGHQEGGDYGGVMSIISPEITAAGSRSA